MIPITKKLAYDAIQEGTAKFVSEEHIAKDCWLMTYKLDGQTIEIGAFGYDRWLDDDVENIKIS